MENNPNHNVSQNLEIFESFSEIDNWNTQLTDLNILVSNLNIQVSQLEYMCFRVSQLEYTS